MKKIILTAFIASATLLTSIPTHAAVTYSAWRLYSRDLFYVGYQVYTECKYSRTVRDGAYMYTQYANKQVKGTSCPRTP